MADPRVELPVRPSGEGVHYPVDQGVAEIDLLAQVEALTRAIGNLENAVRSPKLHRPVKAVAQGNTNTETGDIVLPVYQVGRGFIFHLDRLNVEAGTFDASGAVTPASPSTAGWFGMFETPDPTAVGQGAMFDFMPVTSGGQVLPAVAEYPNGEGESGGVHITGGNWIVLYGSGLVHPKRVTVRYQGWLESAQV